MLDPMPEETRSENAEKGGGRGSADRDLVVLVDRSIDSHLVVYHDPSSAISEQYRTFRTNLQAMNPDGSPRALAITSSIKGEGKSVTAGNLALALAELADTRTLLVDADLRQPRIAAMFGRPPVPGLSDLLQDGLPLDRVIQRTLVPGLSILAAGRPVRNPSELLGSPRIGDLVSALKAEYNYLLFDTAPVLPFVDAAVLGARMDGVLMVVRLDRTPREQVEKSLETLRNARSNVLGCFLAGSRALQERDRGYVIEDE